jgi:hypothetical protein
MVVEDLIYNKVLDIGMPWNGGVIIAVHAYFFNKRVCVLRMRARVSLLLVSTL